MAIRSPTCYTGDSMSFLSPPHLWRQRHRERQDLAQRSGRLRPGFGLVELGDSIKRCGVRLACGRCLGPRKLPAAERSLTSKVHAPSFAPSFPPTCGRWRLWALPAQGEGWGPALSPHPTRKKPGARCYSRPWPHRGQYCGSDVDPRPWPEGAHPRSCSTVVCRVPPTPSPTSARTDWFHSKSCPGEGLLPWPFWLMWHQSVVQVVPMAVAPGGAAVGRCSMD